MENKDLKFTASYITITKHIEQSYDGFISSVVGKIRTLDHVTLVPDVKYQKQVPIMDSTFDFVANDCTTFANHGTSSVSAVVLTAVTLKAEESICLADMEQYYFGQYMKPGTDQRELPFEAAFMEEKYGKIAKKIDKIFWQGGNGVTGLITGATAGGATVVTGSYSVSTSVTNGVIASFNTMLDSLSADMSGEDLVLFVGQDVFDKYVRSVANINFYHYSAEDIAEGVGTLFGKSNVKLVATNGLNGYYKAILTKPEYILYGCDLNPADEALKGEYNFYLDLYLIRYKFKIAPGIALPADAVVAYLN